MPRKFDEPNPYQDPLELERLVRAHDAFVAGLFHPIYWDGPQWEFDWLVQDFIPVGYLVVLAGPLKCGKTCFAAGLPFAGRPVQQGAVLWVSANCWKL